MLRKGKGHDYLTTKAGNKEAGNMGSRVPQKMSEELGLNRSTFKLSDSQ